MDDALLWETLEARSEDAAQEAADAALAASTLRYRNIGRAGVWTVSLGALSVGGSLLPWFACNSEESVFIDPTAPSGPARARIWVNPCSLATLMSVGGVGALVVGEGLVAWGGLGLGRDLGQDPRLGYAGVGLAGLGLVGGGLAGVGFGGLIWAFPIGVVCSTLHFSAAARWARDLGLVVAPTARGARVSGRW